MKLEGGQGQVWRVLGIRRRHWTCPKDTGESFKVWDGGMAGGVLHLCHLVIAFESITCGTRGAQLEGGYNVRVSKAAAAQWRGRGCRQVELVKGCLRSKLLNRLAGGGRKERQRKSVYLVKSLWSLWPSRLLLSPSSPWDPSEIDERLSRPPSPSSLTRCSASLTRVTCG